MVEEVIRIFSKKGIKKLSSTTLTCRRDFEKNIISKNNPFPYKRGRLECGSCKKNKRTSNDCGFSFISSYIKADNCLKIKK